MPDMWAVSYWIPLHFIVLIGPDSQSPACRDSACISRQTRYHKRTYGMTLSFWVLGEIFVTELIRHVSGRPSASSEECQDSRMLGKPRSFALAAATWCATTELGSLLPHRRHCIHFPVNTFNAPLRLYLGITRLIYDFVSARAVL